MTICASCGHRADGDFKFCPECGVTVVEVPPARQLRKTVTVVFCDLVGSTALGEITDPEALRGVLARYFERMKGIVEGHGGTVEKFIGDAVMAVFGVPVAHEDDALRACRAAVEMRDALPVLGIAGRIGVNTGEVVTGTEERLATGDAVNVAARFEQAAAPGEVLIGGPTHALVREAVVADLLEPLTLKGKSEPVPAFRLVSVVEAPERSHERRFVGREREFAQVVDAWARVSAEARCELVTIVGDAGVGKSRLVAEALDGIEARVVRGRCLPYGEGITYWPVVDVVKQLDALPSDEAAAAAVRSLLGEAGVAASGDEIAWGFRKLLEEQAPLIVIFDDVQWGAETFLDLVESTALLSTGASLLLVCMARPELVEQRPTWPVELRLEPLSPEQADALIGDGVSSVLRERIAVAAGGNPLFISEMLAMAAGDGEDEVPPTLRALLAARLDQLDEAERKVLERGAVEGEIFHRGAVQALAPEETHVTTRLAALVRRRLVRPDRAQLAGDDGYRFRHLLIRDAAYDALSKASRADLHARFAAWLEQHGGGLVELDEILGHHFEQAALYHAELGQPNRELAERAGERLAIAGRRALWRDDFRAAAGLLSRSLELTRTHRLDVPLELDLASAISANVDRSVAAEAADAVAERARKAGNHAGETLAKAVAAFYRSWLAGAPKIDELEKLAIEALDQLDGERDHAELVHAWNVLGYGVANYRARFEDMARAAEEALRHARLAGWSQWHPFTLEMALILGPRPADEALRTMDVLMPDRPNPGTQLTRAFLLAMVGEVEEGWRMGREAAHKLSDARGDDSSPPWLAEIAVLAGEQAAAVEAMTSFCAFLERRGQLGNLSYYASRLGRMLCALGRYEDAESLARQGRELTAAGDLVSETAWRQTQALVDSHRGHHPEAEALAIEAVAFAEQTDGPAVQGDALSDLSAVLSAAGQQADAIAALERALDRYERKANAVMANWTQARLAELASSAWPRDQAPSP